MNQIGRRDSEQGGGDAFVDEAHASSRPWDCGYSHALNMRPAFTQVAVEVQRSNDRGTDVFECIYPLGQLIVIASDAPIFHCGKDLMVVNDFHTASLRLEVTRPLIGAWTFRIYLNDLPRSWIEGIRGRE